MHVRRSVIFTVLSRQLIFIIKKTGELQDRRSLFTHYVILQLSYTAKSIFLSVLFPSYLYFKAAALLSPYQEWQEVSLSILGKGQETSLFHI